MSTYPYIFGARGGGGAAASIDFQINGVSEETLTGPTFNLITELDGVVDSGSYDHLTDTLAFTSTDGWHRPSFWLALPTLTAASEAGHILVFVFENRLNRFGVTVGPSGSANIAWGDGTSVTSNGAAQIKTYTYSSITETVYVDSETGENYKQVIVSITRIGAAITNVDFYNQYPTASAYTQFYGVDYNLSFPNTSQLYIYSPYNRRNSYLQRLRIWAIGPSCNLIIQTIPNLKSVSIPATVNVSQYLMMSCLGYYEFGDINFGTDTNVSQDLYNMGAVSIGNVVANSATNAGYFCGENKLIVKQGTVTLPVATTIYFAWSSCPNLKTIGLITCPLATNYEYAFSSCYSLTSIQFSDCSACTNTTGFLLNCYGLTWAILPGLTRGVNFSNNSMGNYGMNLFANSIGTASGGQTITITGTPFGALVTAADATAVAIALVMTTKGYTIVN
jgi:hypothetical protein